MARYDDFIARKTREYGARFTPPQGAQFIDAYNRGDKFRIRVRTTLPGGATYERWGFVSVTTGWGPAFLLMARRGQRGSSDVLRADDQIIDSRYLA